jgi:surface antigen
LPALIALVSSEGAPAWSRHRRRSVVVLVGQRLVEIGGPALDLEALGQTFDLVGVAADQDRIRHHAVAVAEQHAAGMVADRDDRADQMLVQPMRPVTPFMIGAATGGLLGSQFGGGAGKGVMTGLGVVGGALAGGYVGRSAEGCNRPRQRAAAPGAAGGPRTCRSVSTQAVIDGQNQPVEGVACLDPDGVWRTATGPAAERAAEDDLVLRAQQRLHDQGFYVRNNIDGRWGPATSSALRNFQQANGIASTGQLDAPTRTALDLAPVPLTDLAAQSTAAQSTPPAQTGAEQPATTPVSTDPSSIYK